MGSSAKVKRNKKTYLRIDIIAYNDPAKLSRWGESRTSSLLLLGTLLKMPKTIAGLALLFEIIDGGRHAVGIVATARALEWADYLLSHANRLYSIATNQSIHNARLILERKNKLPNPFTAREVHRKNWVALDSITVVNKKKLFLLFLNLNIIKINA